MNGLALCSGVGGLELGLSLAVSGYRTVCYVEREAFAAAILTARMEDKTLDEAPIWDDLTTFDGRAWRGVVDIVTAGFPCQPFSTASRGRRVADDLWPHVRGIIEESRPRFVFIENVAHEPIRTAAQNLEVLGYTQAHDPFEASELGAPYQRRRWFLLAYLDRNRKPGQPFDAKVARPSTMEEANWWTDMAPGTLGVPALCALRMDRIRALGNGVVPLQAAHAFFTLNARFKNSQ